MKCLQCKSETSNPKFCSRSCSAIYNNLLGIYKRREPEGKCRSCENKISTRKTWCDDCLYGPPGKSRTFSTDLEGPCPDSADRGILCACGTIISFNSDRCQSCSAIAINQARRQMKISQWLVGKWRGGSDIKLSEYVRNYLLEKAEYKCSRCGFNTPHPDDGKTILEINHIDGDGTNHSPDNLEVLCPNDHALTSSYRGRNAGKGRPTYYLRVANAINH